MMKKPKEGSPAATLKSNAGMTSTQRHHGQKRRRHILRHATTDDQEVPEIRTDMIVLLKVIQEGMKGGQHGNFLLLISRVFLKWVDLAILKVLIFHRKEDSEMVD